MVRLWSNVRLHGLHILIEVVHGRWRLCEVISGDIVLDWLDRGNVLGLGQVGQHGQLLTKL